MFECTLQTILEKNAISLNFSIPPDADAKH